MKTFTQAAQLLLTLLLYPLALAHVWYRRTWCFYDLPEELKSILAATTGEVKNFIAKQAAAHEELSDGYKDLRSQLIEIQQKQIRNPIGNGFDGGGADELTDLIFKSEALEAFRKGASPAVNIQVPSRSLRQYKTSIVNATGQNQPLVAADRRPEIFFGPQRALRIRDVFASLQTSGNMVEFTRELSFTNAAAPQGGTTSPDTATEGEAKAESAMTFELAQAPVITLAHFIPASRQVLSDSAALQMHVDGRLRYGLMLEEEDELINGTGANGTLNGLVNQATAFTGGATNQTVLDTIAKGLQQLIASEYNPTHIIMNSADWLAVQLLKDTTGRYLFGDPQAMTVPALWGKPVIATNSLAAGNWLVIDTAKAGFIADREFANVRVAEQHSDYFTRNLVAILAEERLALCIVNSAAIIYGAVSYAG